MALSNCGKEALNRSKVKSAGNWVCTPKSKTPTQLIKVSSDYYKLRQSPDPAPLPVPPSPAQ